MANLEWVSFWKSDVQRGHLRSAFLFGVPSQFTGEQAMGARKSVTENHHPKHPTYHDPKSPTTANAIQESSSTCFLLLQQGSLVLFLYSFPFYFFVFFHTETEVEYVSGDSPAYRGIGLHVLVEAWMWARGWGHGDTYPSFPQRTSSPSCSHLLLGRQK